MSHDDDKECCHGKNHEHSGKEECCGGKNREEQKNCDKKVRCCQRRRQAMRLRINQF